ncbi:MAG: amidohydrolase family protein [Desulfobacterales bacterium]|nr:amidohydrolase family protein [Desulfobacterales bacterium]MBF0396325.1 amidohydrolase family protein [Desulfobacterales bacterium]
MKIKDISVFCSWLIDGLSDKIQENVLLTFKNGFISKIESVKKEDLSIDSVFDFSNCTILPGFIDSHVHLFMSGDHVLENRKVEQNNDYNKTKEIIDNNVRKHIKRGIVAVRDAGDNRGYTLNYKPQIPFYLNKCGKALYKEGRYGNFIGTPVSYYDLISELILRERNKINHIKIINSGINSLTEFGKETKPQFNEQELSEAVFTAKSIGAKVMVHANGRMPVEISIKSGCHSIEHGYFMGIDNLKKMADFNIFWVPTVYPIKAYLEKGKLSKLESDNAARILEHQLEQIFQAKRLGVKIALGTDSGSFGVLHGDSFICELKLLLNAGFSVVEAVKSATINASILLGLDEIGSIAKGKQATFIAVKGHPSHSIESLQNIEALYIRGCLHDQ